MFVQKWYIMVQIRRKHYGHDYSNQTLMVQLQQADHSSRIRVNLAFVISNEKEKNIRGGRKEKLERKRGRTRNKKISPVLGPVLILPMKWGVCQVLGGITFYSDFSQFL